MKKLINAFTKDQALDEKSVKFLVSALEKSNLQGFDYLEFKQSLGALAELQMDDATAIRSAYATASTVGLTKSHLLKTATHYKKILKQEKTQFDAALSKQVQQRVKGKQTEVAKLEKAIGTYQAKIEELQSKIEQAKQVIDTADEQIRAATEKIEQTRDAFEATLSEFTQTIDQDISNIKEYL